MENSDKYKKYVERIDKLGVANIGGGRVKIGNFNWGEQSSSSRTTNKSESAGKEEETSDRPKDFDPEASREPKAEKPHQENTSFSETGEENEQKVIRSIEFPPEYWEAGTSILTYFSRILRVKYPNQNIVVKIEQEDLTLTMVINTPTRQREKIEKTLDEYVMVVTERLQAEIFLEDPLEVMALKNKLEIAKLELKQTRQLLSYTQNNSQNRIESLEAQVKQLYCIIEREFQSKKAVLGVIRDMNKPKSNSYNFNNPKFGGGFATEGGLQVGGTLLDISSESANLSEVATEIEELLQQLKTEGITVEEAQQQVAKDLAKQAENNPTVMGKLVQWGKSLADTASTTIVNEGVKTVLKLSLQMIGIPLP